jgi:hypothetical protein
MFFVVLVVVVVSLCAAECSGGRGLLSKKTLHFLENEEFPK